MSYIFTSMVYSGAWWTYQAYMYRTFWLDDASAGAVGGKHAVAPYAKVASTELDAVDVAEDGAGLEDDEERPAAAPAPANGGKHAHCHKPASASG